MNQVTLTAEQREEVEGYEQAAYNLIKAMRGGLHSVRTSRDEMRSMQGPARKMEIVIAALLVLINNSSRPAHDDTIMRNLMEFLKEAPRSQETLRTIVNFLRSIARDGVAPKTDESEEHEQVVLLFLEEVREFLYETVLGKKVSHTGRVSLQGPPC